MRLVYSLVTKPYALFGLFAAYFLLQTLIRTFLSPALRIDEAQQVLFDQWLAFGYDAQPPLYNWYQQILFSVFGISIAGIAIAKNLVLFLIFFFYIKTARLVLTDRRLVAVAAFALFVIPQVFWQAQRDLTHTTMLMLSVTLLLYLIVKVIQSASLSLYIGIGLCVGMAFLSKYNSLIILPAVLFSVWQHPVGRARILDRRFLVSVAIAAVLCVPHLLWLFDNLGLASDVTLQRMAEDAPRGRLLQIALGILTFIGGAAVISCVPVALIALSLRAGATPREPTGNRDWYRFFRTYFIAIGIIMLVLICVMTLTEIRDRWLLPLFMPLPLLATLWLEQSGFNLARFVSRFVPIGLVTMVLVPLAILVSLPLMALIGQRTSSNYDWKAFATWFETHETLSPALIVTGDWRTGGNLRFQFKDVPVVTITYGDFVPAIDVSDARPILLVQTTGTENFAEMQAWLARTYHFQVDISDIRSVEIPMYVPTRDETLRFNYALIRPADITVIGN